MENLLEPSGSAAMGFWQLATIPLVAALIGWATNWLAVRMIFRPHRPFNLFGLRLQGLVPKRQPELARSIGRTVQEHLISHEDIRRVLGRPEAQAEIQAAIGARLHGFVESQLGRLSPMLASFLAGSLREKLEQAMLEEVTAWIPELTEQLMGRLETEMNFQKLVEEKVRQFDLDRLERIINEIAARELKAIELLGGVLGFVIGLLQVAILML